MTCAGLDPLAALDALTEQIRDIVDNGSGDLVDKLEDALEGLETVQEELDKDPPDNQAAVGKMEGVAGDIDAAIDKGLDEDEAIGYMEDLAGIARAFAGAAVAAMTALVDCDSDGIADAEEAMDEGDEMRAEGKYKDAISKYKDAVSKGESCTGGGALFAPAQQPSLPSGFALHDNTPNPFNPTTTISYSVPTSARVTLRIYDVQGRLVQTLVDETKMAGQYSATWQGRDSRSIEVASGVYFVRLESGRNVQTKKITLLK